MADLAIRIEQMKAKKDAEDGVTFEEEGKVALSAEDKPIQLAILGRQNVGKSTLVNKLVKSERVLSGPLAGLTRDAIAVNYKWEGKEVQLVRCDPSCFFRILGIFAHSFFIVAGRYSWDTKVHKASE